MMTDMRGLSNADEDSSPMDDMFAPELEQEEPMLGAHAALGQRIGNPVLDSPPFDETALGADTAPAFMANTGSTPTFMEQPGVKEEMTNFLAEKAKARRAASEQYQMSALRMNDASKSFSR